MRREETQRRNARRLSVFLMIAMIGGLFTLDVRDHARRVEVMKKDHAEEMAECLMDWKAGKNGGCDWKEETVIFGGEPLTVDVEVLARPLD